jgi:hypothetical protein
MYVSTSNVMTLYANTFSFRIADAASGAIGTPKVIINSNGPNAGSPQTLVMGVDGAGFSQTAYLDTQKGGVSATTPLAFRMNGTEYMRVHTNGYVGIGLTTPEAALDVYSSKATARMARICNIKNDGGSQDTCFIHTDQPFSTATTAWSGSALTVTTYPNNNSTNNGYIARFGTSDAGGGSMDPKVVISSGYNTLGFVGIGTTTPGQTLDVSGSIQTNGSIFMTGQGSTAITATRGAIWWAGTGDYNHVLYNNYLNRDGLGSFDGMRWMVYNGIQICAGSRAGVASLSGLAFSMNSSGQINMPLQPAFRAYYGTGASTDFTTTTVLPYNATQVNIGSCYSTSTYKFTAPVAGRYAFGASTYCAAANSMWDITTANLGIIARAEWRVNGASQGQNSIIGTTTVAELSAGDTVWVAWASDTVRLIGATKFISFWGYLIG